jgi:hypothetical protein
VCQQYPPLVTFYSRKNYDNYSKRAYLKSIAKRESNNASIPIARIVLVCIGVLILMIVHLIRKYKPDNPV